MQPTRINHDEQITVRPDEIAVWDEIKYTSDEPRFYELANLLKLNAQTIVSLYHYCFTEHQRQIRLNLAQRAFDAYPELVKETIGTITPEKLSNDTLDAIIEAADAADKYRFDTTITEHTNRT